MMDAAGHVRLVARPVPTIAPVVRGPPIPRPVGREEDSVLLRVARERLEHRLYLGLGRMSPNRVREEEVEFLSEDGGVEVRVRVEARALQLSHRRFEKHLDAELQPLPVGFDSEIAADVQETYEPVAGAEDTAAQVDHFGVRVQSGRQQKRQLLPAALLEVQDGDTEKPVPAQALELPL